METEERQNPITASWLLRGFVGDRAFLASDFRVDEFAYIPLDWTLDSLLRRIKTELKVDVVFLHVDEYKMDVTAVYAMLICCGSSNSSNVEPDKAGIYDTAIEGLTPFSDPSVNKVTLSGNRDMRGLSDQVAKKLEISL